MSRVLSFAAAHPPVAVEGAWHCCPLTACARRSAVADATTVNSDAAEGVRPANPSRSIAVTRSRAVAAKGSLPALAALCTRPMPKIASMMGDVTSRELRENDGQSRPPRSISARSASVKNPVLNRGSKPDPIPDSPSRKFPCKGAPFERLTFDVGGRADRQ